MMRQRPEWIMPDPRHQISTSNLMQKDPPLTAKQSEQDSDPVTP